MVQFRAYSMSAAAATMQMKGDDAQDKVADFYAKVQSSNEVKMADVTSMIRETLIGSKLSVDQFEELQPVIDEVVSIVGKVDSSDITVEDVQSLLAFGMVYEVSETGYWRVTQQAAEQCLESLTGKDLEKIVTIVT